MAVMKVIEVLANMIKVGKMQLRKQLKKLLKQ